MSRGKRALIWFVIIFGGSLAAGIAGFMLGGRAPSELAQALTSGDTLTASCLMTTAWEHRLCGHEESETAAVPQEYIGKTRAQVAALVSPAVITYFSAKSMKLRFDVDDYCERHVLAYAEGNEVIVRRGSRRAQEGEVLARVAVSAQELEAISLALGKEKRVFTDESDAYTFLWNSGIRRTIY